MRRDIRRSSGRKLMVAVGGATQSCELSESQCSVPPGTVSIPPCLPSGVSMKKKSALDSGASEAPEVVSEGPRAERRASARRGRPQSEGGVRGWLRRHGIQTLFIDPDVPLGGTGRDL